MTKEELLSDTHIVRSFNGEAVYVQMMALNKFFESNVVIPKGATLQYYDGIQCKWIDKINIYEGTEYRIKPSVNDG